MHWNRSCSTWCRTMVNPLIMILGRIKCRKLIIKNIFCSPDVFHVSVGKHLSRLSIERELGIAAGWLGTWDNLPLWFDSTSWNSSESSIEFICYCISCNCEGCLCIVSWLSLNFYTDNSSTRSSWALFISPNSWTFRMWLSRSAFSHNLLSINLLLGIINSDLAWESKWSSFASRCDFPTFARSANLKKQNEHYSRNGFPVGYFGFFRKTCSDSIHCGMKTLRQVSLKLRDLERSLSSNFLVLSDKIVFVVHLPLASVHTPHQISLTLQDSEKNRSSSFLVQRDKLVLVLHFLLVPVFSVVKPASYVIARLRGPSRASSQCSLPNRKQNVSMIGCTTTVWHQFPQDRSGRQLFDSVGWPDSCRARYYWAHNLWRSGIPQTYHAAVELPQWMNGCVENRSGFGEEDDSNTREVGERELVLVFSVLWGARWNMARGWLTCCGDATNLNLSLEPCTHVICAVWSVEWLYMWECGVRQVYLSSGRWWAPRRSSVWTPPPCLLHDTVVM